MSSPAYSGVQVAHAELRGNRRRLGGSADSGVGRVRATIGAITFNYLLAGLTVLKQLVLVPFFLHFIDFGTYSSWLATGNVLALLGILDGGLSVIYVQRMSWSWSRGDMRYFRQTVGSSLALLALLIPAVVVIAAVFAGRIPAWMRVTTAQRPGFTFAFLLGVAGLAFTLLQNVVLSALLAWQRTVYAGVIRLAGQLVEIVVCIIALRAGYGIIALGAGASCGAAFVLIAASLRTYSLWRSETLGPPQVNRAALADLIRNTAPTFISRSASVLAANSDSLLVLWFIGPVEAGMYALTVRLVRTSEWLTATVASSVSAPLAHLCGSGNEPAIRRRIGEALAVSATLAAITLPLSVGLGQSFMAVWLGPEKFAGLSVLILTALVSAMTTRLDMINVALRAMGDFAAPSWFGVLEIAVRLPLAAWLLKKVGLWGIPAASIVSVGGIALVLSIRRLNERLNLDWVESFRLQCIGVPASSLTFGLGMLAASRLPSASGWSLFTRQAVTLSGVITIAALAAATTGRRVLTDITRVVRQRSR